MVRLNKEIAIITIFLLSVCLSNASIARRPVLPMPDIIKNPRVYWEIVKTHHKEFRKAFKKWKLVNLLAVSNSKPTLHPKIVETADDVSLKMAFEIKGKLSKYNFYRSARIRNNKDVQASIDVWGTELFIDEAEKLDIIKLFLRHYPSFKGEISRLSHTYINEKNVGLKVSYGFEDYDLTSQYSNRCYDKICLSVSPEILKPPFRLQIPFNSKLLLNLSKIFVEFKPIISDDLFKILQTRFPDRFFGIIYSGRDAGEIGSQVTVIFPYFWGEDWGVSTRYYFRNGVLINKSITHDQQLFEKIKKGEVICDPKSHYLKDLKIDKSYLGRC